MKEKDMNSKKKDATKTTLLDAIERVVVLSRDSQLCDAFYEEAEADIDFIAGKYGISKQQAVLFCVCMERGPRRVNFSDFANHLDISNIRALGLASDVDALVNRRLLRYRDVSDGDSFDVFKPVIRALQRNEPYELPSYTGLDCSELFGRLNIMFDDLDNDAVSLATITAEINVLLRENPQIGFVQKLKELYLNNEHKMLLLLFCHLLVNKDDNDIRFNQMKCVFDSLSSYNRGKGLLRNGEHRIMTDGLVEHRSEDGIADTSRYRLTDNAKRNLLSEMKLTACEEKLSGVLSHKDLAGKRMFYTEEIKRQVDELSNFLLPEQYAKIHERMKQRGFRQGFACLFYGGPGTGKTETVYQLARQTERDIMVVDVPQIKSKWVGDSEKNIKALFDKYRELVKRAKVAPILLFNEADAIIGMRKSGATNAVDKMENTIQNIILQEMESLDGILIATTNLADNLDSAFERRFLYKIQFCKPDASVRSLIWQQMIPELNATDATTLAAAYDFSGGQIENIARKHAIHAVLHGEPESLLHTLQGYCATEKLESKPLIKRIGF